MRWNVGTDVLWRVQIGRATCGLLVRGDRIIRYAPYLGRWCRGADWPTTRQQLLRDGARIEDVSPQPPSPAMSGLFDSLPGGLVPVPDATLRPGQPRIVIFGPRDQKQLRAVVAAGAMVINTTSHSDDWGRQLSPFLLGPVALYDGIIAQNVENAWQFGKVHAEHVGPDNKPTEAWWRWARAGWALRKAIRYPMGKGAVPAFSWWKGQALTYVEARRHIYVPLYSGAVRKTDAWRKLVQMMRRGETIYLWDFDGYDYQAEGISIEQALEDPQRKFGHSMVLAMMLEREDAPW